MKDFFKKNPEFIYILVAVLIIDGVIIWFCMGDNAATADKQKELDTLRSKASSINDSKYRTNKSNAAGAIKKAENVEKQFKVKLAKKLEQYKYKKTKEETFTRTPQALANFRDLLEKLSKKMKDQNKTADKFSFNEFQQRDSTNNIKLLKMETKQIQTVFEILNGFMKIADNCLTADIESIDEVIRPLELTFLKDSELGIKTYSYKVKLSGNGGSIKRLINLISSDEEYFFEVSSIKLLADEQIKTDAGVVPLIDRESVPSSDPEGTGTGPGALEELERGLQPGGAVAPEEGEVKISKESVSPFSPAVNRVELVIDWIQFVKTEATKKTR